MDKQRFYKNGVAKTKDLDNIKYSYTELRNDIIKSDAYAVIEGNSPLLRKSSKRIDYNSLAAYCFFLQEKIDALVKKYKKEQSEGIDELDLQLRKDLVAFRLNMYQGEQAKKTIKSKFGRVKHLFREQNIKIPNIPEDKSVDARVDENELKFEDLPTMEMVKEAVRISKPKPAAVIIWLACTGTGNAETTNMTVEEVMSGLKEFCQSTNYHDMIKELDGKCDEKGVIPIIHLKRKKTSREYYTCCTPECVQYLIDYIKTKPSILDNPDNHFFGYYDETGAGVRQSCNKVNDELGWGKTNNGYRRFGPHRLRHFHTTELDDMSLANQMEGRKSKDVIENTYRQHDSKKMREKYKLHMNKFTIFAHYDVMLNSEAYNELKSQLYEEKLQHQKELDEQKKSYDKKIAEITAQNKEIANQNQKELTELKEALNKITNADSLESKEEYYDIFAYVLSYFQELHRNGHISSEEEAGYLTYIAVDKILNIQKDIDFVLNHTNPDEGSNYNEELMQFMLKLLGSIKIRIKLNPELKEEAQQKLDSAMKESDILEKSREIINKTLEDLGLEQDIFSIRKFNEQFVIDVIDNIGDNDMENKPFDVLLYNALNKNIVKLSIADDFEKEVKLILDKVLNNYSIS